MRWLYHVVERCLAPGGASDYAPPSLGREGFIHASYRDDVGESARLYFPPGADLVVLRIDPRRLGVPVDVASTPRGPMPHIRGPVAASAIAARVAPSEVGAGPDLVIETD